ncbi:bifunctional riboflavin kinase/FAD synthetase [Arenibaculum pallidiluteum]|uniref:bifunctional riboflavin kinase/FAD synthetase n=1 Tax=Arenibaculum pallidiluteum TaxID=2812559 RepID=UPI001A975F3C|nr:bifunctional riboflavin kinase/FAD synthetase [Arenibaculum pallidiluteum]
MRLFRHWTDLPADARGAAVALGNFDGVHRGHRAVIAAARTAAPGAPAGVLSFEPHPREVFRPDDPPFRLTPFRAKARLLEEIGLDLLFVLHFDRSLAEHSAEDFVEEILVRGLGVAHVAVGKDFCFGRGRSGDAGLLSRLGAHHGFGVSVVPHAMDPDGRPFSSTRVRNALRAGRPGEAAEVLGRHWEIEGRVETGFQRGRTIGFPTANIGLDGHLRPAFGVYAVQAGIDQGLGTVWRDGVANIGLRPTVGGTTELLEVHLFDMAEDLYGRHMRVRLVDFLRPERKFDGLDALKAQIAQDAARARAILSRPGGAGTAPGGGEGAGA